MDMFSRPTAGGWLDNSWVLWLLGGAVEWKELNGECKPCSLDRLSGNPVWKNYRILMDFATEKWMKIGGVLRLDEISQWLGVVQGVQLVNASLACPKRCGLIANP